MPTQMTTRPGKIQEARLRRGIGVRALARLAGVTPGAVSQWENSERQGTLRDATLQRALEAMGTTIENEFPSPSTTPLERREDRVALELHRIVASKLVMNPDKVLSVVPENIESMRTRVQGQSAQINLDHWLQLASAPTLGPLIDQMLCTDAVSVAMRQTSPFMGVLTQEEREQAIKRAAL
jgi:transcriptional regulator with XRE-family HTH domain